MKSKPTVVEVLINITCVLALIVVVSPLLLLGGYNYPSADDWSYGADSYRVIQNGGGLFAVLGVAFQTAWEQYFVWESRFSNAFLAALQPGIWGEEYYGLVVWLMSGIIILSEMWLFKNILCMKNNSANRWLWLPIIAPALILQFLYCPSPEESFYWYTGAVNYTFIYGLSFLLLVLFMKMGMTECTKWKYAVMVVCASVLAVLVGGDNFATSLATFLTLCVLSVLFLLYNRRAFFKTWFVSFLVGMSLLLCILAPGNEARINANFGGETGGVIEAVWMSLVRSFLNIYSWTNIKVILMLIFILPFMWKCVKNMEWHFKLPGIFTLLTFGIYASQIAATMFVDGTTGGGRMAAILFYSYYVWIVGNAIYWLGWLSKHQNRLQGLLDQIQNKYGKLLIPYCGLIGIMLVGIIYTSDLKELTSYRAYRSLRQGWAQQYAAEWEERLEVLHDDSVKDVVFEPMSVYPEMILYTDLQDEYGYTWVNHACAEYYGKNSIVVKSAQ